jgi:hypothetical protein
MKMIKALRLAVLCVLCAGVSAQETVFYRWIDQHGQVQYTDYEPAGVSSQRVEMQATSDGNSELDAPVLQRGEDVWQPDPFHDQDDQILPIEHIGPCANARQQLTVLHTELPVYEATDGVYRPAWRGDSYRGQRQYLSDEERQSAISDARTSVLDACSDPEAFQEEVRTFKQSIESE